MHRGCWNDISEAHKTICQSEDDDRCDKCLENGCNTHYKGAAAALVPITGTVAILIALLHVLVQQ